MIYERRDEKNINKQLYSTFWKWQHVVLKPGMHQALPAPPGFMDQLLAGQLGQIPVTVSPVQDLDKLDHTAGL